MTDGPVCLRILGRVELSGPDARPVASLLAQPRRLALLIYLATASPPGLHRKDTIRALFWPDADSLRARQALNRAIYVLRQALDPGVLVTRGDDEVGVAEARLSCDAVLFQEALERAEWETALELYHGDLAPGFLVSGLPDFDRWLETERARLRQRAVEAAMELARHEESKGRLELAERWLRRAEVLSPYDERAAARRIAVLDRMGDRAGALRAFDELRHRLREELEVDPSPETVALAASVRVRSESKPPAGWRGSESSATPAESLPPFGGTPREAVPAVDGLRLRGPILAGALTLGLVAVLSALLVRPPTRVLTTTNAVAVTSEPGIEFQPSLSSDGSLVAFAIVGERRTTIAVRSTSGPVAGEGVRPALSDGGDQTLPTWSVDGKLVRYVSTPNPGVYPASFAQAGNRRVSGWKEVDRLGGPPGAVMLPRVVEWAAWSRDGARLAFTVDDSIYTSSTTDSHPRLLAVHQGGWSPNSLAWSPDGRWIAYVNGNPFWPGRWNTAPSEIWLVATAGGRRVQVTDARHLNVSPAWLDAGHLLFVSDQEGQREVYVIEVGPRGPQGQPVKVPGGTDAHTISVSADGRRLAVARLLARQNVWSFPRTTTRPLSAHEGQPVTSGSQVVETHDVSPDGQWLAYDTNLHGDADIYKVRLDGGPPIPVVSGPTVSYSPRWSPDGREIAFYGGESDDIWVVSAEGGPPTRLTNTDGIDELPIWSPDGLGLAYRANRSGRLEAWTVTRDRIGGAWHEPRRLTDLRCSYQVWAHDGSGVLCGSPGETVLSLVSPSGRVLWRRDLAASGLSEIGPPAISPDGTMLYLRAARDGEAGIWVWPIAGGEPQMIVTFEDPSMTVLSYPGTINVTGDRLYLTVGEFESDIWVMDLVRR